MLVHHRPYLDTNAIAAHYSERDGVDVSYVCTSAIDEYSERAVDIFYRATPHPEFGNRYFGIYEHNGEVLICNADAIEQLRFEMILDGKLHYSRHRHDFAGTPSGYAIDGGRAYRRVIGNATGLPKSFSFRVLNGIFVEAVNG